MYWKVANGLEMFRVQSVLPDVLFVGQLSAIQQVLLLTKLGAFGTQGSVYLGCAYGQCCPAAKPASPTIRSDGQKCQRTCEVDPSWSLLSSALILIHTIQDHTFDFAGASYSKAQAFAGHTFSSICRGGTIFEFWPCADTDRNRFIGFSFMLQLHPTTSSYENESGLAQNVQQRLRLPQSDADVACSFGSLKRLCLDVRIILNRTFPLII